MDATDIFVGRAAVNVLEESSAGIIVTHGDPRSNLDNSLVGLDFRYSNSRLPAGRVLETDLWRPTSGINAPGPRACPAMTAPTDSGSARPT